MKDKVFHTQYRDNPASDPETLEPLFNSTLGKNNMADMVNNPPHYNRKNIECIQAIEASMDDKEFRGYLKGNILKYLWRCDYKGHSIQDLEKSSFYLNLMILKTKEQQSATTKSQSQI